MRISALLLTALFAAAGCGGGQRRRSAPTPPPSPLAKAVIRTAKSYLPEEDSKHPLPKDCSDFVGKVFAAHKIALPRNSGAMAIEGEEVPAGNLRMGDLVFFAGAKGGRRIGHVAIYINNGIFIHQANPGEGVRQESLYSDYWRKHYLRGRRVLD